MGSDSNLGASASASSSPTAKRTRDPEEELYLDNLRSHKRYLSEIMASSLNGLTVGDSLPDNLMESPVRSESAFFLRDDMSLQYSPMSEDSDDSRFCETPVHSCPSSPGSPYRHQRPPNVFSSVPSTSSSASHGPTVSTSQSRQRNSDSEGRFPSSPSDICHSAHLRRAALLRSVQMRTHPHGSASLELPFGSGQYPAPNIVDPDERSCSYMKSLVDEREYQIEECIPEPIFNNDNKQCSGVSNVKEKIADSGG